jgi:5-methyltetrahydropteroyltriglutamate--homocysteine methyltransferase
MKRSTDRILTTHAGRLDGRDWQEMARSGDAGDTAALQSRMVKVIREQAGAGIDVVSDGELGKVGFGLPYYGRRSPVSRPVR